TIANWSTLKAINTNWIAEKKIRMLAQWALQKSPELDGVPLFLDLAKSDAERDALRLMLARLEYGRPFFLPPNVPPARVDALRRPFDATMKDPAYLAEAEKLKIDVDPLPGEAVAALSSRSRARPPTPSPASVRRWRTSETWTARDGAVLVRKRTPADRAFRYKRAARTNPPEFGPKDGSKDR